MKKVKVIRSWNGSFWDNNYQSFRGFLFATHYPVDDFFVYIENDLEEATKQSKGCEIVMFYI